MKDSQLIDLFQKSRKNHEIAVIEGIQALKHALRFSAEVSHIISSNQTTLEEYFDKLAPDVKGAALKKVTEVSGETFSKLSPQPPRTGVIALAKRRHYRLSHIDAKKPIIFLEGPRDLENIGAVIRVAAAADAAGVLISGPVDIWHPAVVRGAAALHYALPVLNSTLSDIKRYWTNRPLVSLDPAGQAIAQETPSADAVLIFGTERFGIMPETLELSDTVLSLPMKKGVSSLNLATSVAATLYMM